MNPMSEHLPNQESSDSDGPLAHALDDSHVAAALRAPFRDDSWTSWAAHWLSGTVRNSFIYRWLTKDPEPEMIGIDLHETWTVGPIICALNQVVAWIAPAWYESTLKRGLDFLGIHMSIATETRYGKLLVKLLEPPEPPGDMTEDYSDTERSTDEDE